MCLLYFSLASVSRIKSTCNANNFAFIQLHILGALDGRSPMSHVDFKKWQCHNTHYISLSQTCPVNPIDPNPAVAARAVLPQSGRSRPEKRQFFHIFPHFSKIEPFKKYLPHTGVQYIKLKLMKCPFQYKRNQVGSTLNLDTSSTFWGIP